LIRNVRIECTENKGSRNGRGYATEKANFITLTVVLHEEGVAIDDVVVQVPRKLLVESPGNSVDEGGEYARLVVGPEAGLRSMERSVGVFSGETEAGEELWVTVGEPHTW
jgi:hypothetical protein